LTDLDRLNYLESGLSRAAEGTFSLKMVRCSGEPPTGPPFQPDIGAAGGRGRFGQSALRASCQGRHGRRLACFADFDRVIFSENELSKLVFLDVGQ
jgi:hypothetical protein